MGREGAHGMDSAGRCRRVEFLTHILPGPSWALCLFSILEFKLKFSLKIFLYILVTSKAHHDLVSVNYP